MLEVKVERCAGIDVGKKFMEVCVLIGPVNRKPAEEVRRFGSNVRDLEALRAWLLEKGCREVVMGRVPGLTGNRYSTSLRDTSR